MGKSDTHIRISCWLYKSQVIGWCWRLTAKDGALRSGDNNFLTWWALVPSGIRPGSCQEGFHCGMYRFFCFLVSEIVSKIIGLVDIRIIRYPCFKITSLSGKRAISVRSSHHRYRFNRLSLLFAIPDDEMIPDFEVISLTFDQSIAGDTEDCSMELIKQKRVRW